MYHYLLWKFFLLLKSSFIKLSSVKSTYFIDFWYRNSLSLFSKRYNILFAQFCQFLTFGRKEKNPFLWILWKIVTAQVSKTFQRREREMEWKDNAPHRVKCAAKVHLVFICHRRHSRRGTHLDFGFWRSLGFLTFDIDVRFCHWPFWS